MELIDEIKIELRVINAYNGNINLVEKAYDFIGNKLTEEYSKANEALKPYFYDYHSWKLITEFVFKPCKDICYFIDNPFKVMRYVKFYLTQYDIPFRNFIREMMIVVLEDSYRIKPIIDVEINVENKLKNVISEIKSIDTTKPFELREIVGFTDLEYLNDGKNFYDDAKRFTLIHMSIEGCILSKVEVHERYISENFSPALIEAFEKSAIASIINKIQINNISTKRNEGIETNRKEIEPIKWQGTHVQLTYLFKQLQSAKLIPDTINLWALLERYFIDKDGNEIKNLAQSYDGMTNSKSGKPNKHEILNNIVEEVKKQS